MKYFLLLFFFPALLCGQPTGIPLRAPSYALTERLEVLSGGGSPAFHAVFQGYCREAVAQMASQWRADTALYRRNSTDIDYLLAENDEFLPTELQTEKEGRGLFGIFYKTPANLLEVETAALRLKLNPVIGFEIGEQKNDPELLFANRRGIEIHGDIDHRIWFQTGFEEQQVRFPNYINQRIATAGAVPGAGFFKGYESSIFNIRSGYDYNVATAFIGFKVCKQVQMQFGHGSHIIGNGFRSLILSDFGNPNLFLKINTQLGKFQYQNIFMELNPFAANAQPPGNQYDNLLQKKYAVVHSLDFKASRTSAIGISEATMYNQSASFSGKYLQPVLLLNSVNRQNSLVLLGLHGHWDLWRKFRLYGQYVANTASLKPGTAGWWGNQTGWQAGLKYFNVLNVHDLDVQVEVNSVRPYMYMDADSLNNWTHYRHPLAHPLGANFKELIGVVRFRPLPQLSLSARALWMHTADDAPNENNGQNLYYSTASRKSDTGNAVGQGIKAKTTILGLEASWALFHNCYLDFSAFTRKKDSDDDLRDATTTTFNIGLRLNYWTLEQAY